MGNDVNVISVVNRTSGRYGVVVVNTKTIDEASAKKLLSEIRSVKGSHDAFMKVNYDTPSVAPTVATNTDDIKPDTKDAQSDQDTQTQQVAEDVLPVIADTADSNDTAQTVEDNSNVVAQDSANLVTLSQAVKTILDSNPNVRESIFVYQQAGKDLGIANSAYYPSLNLNGAYGIRKQTSKDNNGIQKGKGRVSQIGATLTENIYNGGADVSRQHEQSSRLDAAAYSVLQSADRYSLQMVEAYLNVIKTKKLLDIAEESVKSHREIYAQIKERTESGFGRTSQQRQAGSRLTLAESNKIAAQSNYQDAVSTFAKLYGKPLQADQLVEPSFELSLPASISEITDKSMQCNPSVLLQNANIQVAQFSYEGAKSPFKPKLDLELSANYSGNNVLTDTKTYTKDYDAMLRLRYNLYNKGIDKLNKEKSAIDMDLSYQAMDKVKRELNESINFSWHSYVLNAKKLDFLKEHVNYSKATLDSYQDEFRIGRRDLINLLDAEDEYFTAIREVTETQSSLLLAKYRLLDNMGMLTDSFEPGFSKSYIQGSCSIQNNLK